MTDVDPKTLLREHEETIRLLEDEVNRLTALVNASALVGASLDVDEVLRELVQQAAIVLRAEGASLLLLDDEHDELVFRVAYGEKGPDLIDRRFPRDAGIAGAVVTTGEPQLVDHAAQDPRHLSDFDEELQFQTDSILAVPVQVRGELIGVLEVVNSPAQGSFTEDDLSLLIAFAAQAGVALDNARRHTGQQRQVDAVTEAMEDGMIVLENVEEVTLINRAARAMLGIAPDSVVVRTDLAALPCRPPLLLVADVDAHHTTEMVLGPGTQRIFRVSADPLFGPSGERDGVVLVLHDISRIRELERLKSDVITTVSHELRTPVASIQGAIQLLADKTVDLRGEEGRRFIDIIDRNAERLAKLVTSVVDLSQLGLGKLEVSPGMTPLRPILDTAVETATTMVEEVGHSLVLDAPADLPDVWADPRRVGQALQHLLENAAKFTPESGQIEIVAETADPGVIIRVRDTGPGIAPNDREKAFDVFEQLSDPHRDKAPGTGLGLPIARGIIVALGGSMWIEPRDEGTEIAFTLRAEPPEQRP